MNVINKINKMGIIPKENRTYIDFENNVKSHHLYEVISSEKAALFLRQLINHLMILKIMIFYLIMELKLK